MRLVGVAILAAALLLGGAGSLRAQTRPIPYPVVPPGGFREAVARGTRSLTGVPGSTYWQQWTDYHLTARILPNEKRLEGSGRIVYRNRSPFVLFGIALHLYQNHHDSGMLRNRLAPVTDGVEIGRVAADGTELAQLAAPREPGWAVSGTILQLLLPRPLRPGDSTELEIEWSFEIPQQGVGGRMGYDGEELFYLAYWYPQMVVLDDVVGWHAEQFLGRAEFYMGYGAYDLTIEVPEGWVVMSTGELINAEEVLPPDVLARYRRAATSDDVVHVLSEGDLGPGKATRRSEDGYLSWRFQADSVRDVAFAAMRSSLWDAGRASVGDRDGDGEVDYTVINSFWRPSAPRWEQQWRYARQSIAFFSRWMGLPYPWPHMTSVEGGGIESGGMEFPMMTLIGPNNSPSATDTSLYSVTAHELAHMWFPMIVGADEKRYGWMDEGTASFSSGYAGADFYPGRDSIMGTRDGYLGLARRGGEGEVMRWSDYHYSDEAYSIASYSKPATLLNTLRGLLGPEHFDSIFREYVRTWAFKHPKPWDFFNFFSSASGLNLEWFWRAWYYETWTLDQAIAEVTSGDGGTIIVIEDRGRVPMPSRVTVTREGGQVSQHEVPVEVWLSGETRAEITVPGQEPVVRVEIDAANEFPDIDRENNVWERSASG